VLHQCYICQRTRIYVNNHRIAIFKNATILQDSESNDNISVCRPIGKPHTKLDLPALMFIAHNYKHGFAVEIIVILNSSLLLDSLSCTCGFEDIYFVIAINVNLNMNLNWSQPGIMITKDSTRILKLRHIHATFQYHIRLVSLSS